MPGEHAKTHKLTNLDCLLLFGNRLHYKVRGTAGQRLQEWLIGKLLKIRDKEGKLVALVPNKAQRKLSEEAGGRSIILKARQMGITTWVAARFFMLTITRRGTLTVLVAHDQQSAEYIFRIVHRFWENLPECLRSGALKTSRANVRQLVFPLLDSEYRVESAADADAGRGLTIQNLHGSEVARWPGDASATLASLRAAVTPKGMIVLESTARGAAGCFYNEWQRAQETGYVRHFFPWWWEESYQDRQVWDASQLTEEEKELMLVHGLTGEQIAYRREMVAGLMGLARQEYAEDPESCFLRSGDCVFDIDIVLKRMAECKESSPAKVRDRVTSWIPPMTGRMYIIGVDPAGGGCDGDYACAQVIDKETGMQCAELHGHLTPEELSRAVSKLGSEYNKALIVVERNYQGGEVLTWLSQVCRYSNIYSENGQGGCMTTIRTRPEIIGAVSAAIYTHAESFQSPALLEEMKTFVRRRNGSGAAATGTYDDRVMALGIALRVRERGIGAKRGLKSA